MQTYWQISNRYGVVFFVYFNAGRVSPTIQLCVDLLEGLQAFSLFLQALCTQGCSAPESMAAFKVRIPSPPSPPPPPHELLEMERGDTAGRAVSSADTSEPV